MRQTYTTDKGKRITLEDADYIAAGGEATIYGRGDTIYKVYTDRLNMIPLEKMRELRMLLTRETIIKPDHVLYDKNGFPAGFTLKWLKEATSLCRLFTNAYRDANRIGHQQTIDLMQQIREDMAFMHSRCCLIIDCNEYNILVDTNDHRTPYYIDVDSYQTPNHPARVLAPEIRDYHSKGFSTATDWFAFAILACQAFIGIHPYRGSHPGYKRGDIEGRMRDNVSIFNPRVTLPSTARPLDAIPGNYSDWLYSVLEKAERTEPPTTIQQRRQPPAARKAPPCTTKITLTIEAQYDGAVLQCIATQGGIAACTATQLNAWGRHYDILVRQFAPANTPVGESMVILSEGRLALMDRSGNVTATPLPAEAVIHGQGHVYALSDDACTEIALSRLNSRTVATASTKWPVHPTGRQAYPTMIIQWLIGIPYLMIPYDNNGYASMATIRVPMLTGCRVVEAKFQGGICIMATARQCRYDKHVFAMTDDMKSIRAHRTIQDTEDATANFTLLPKGIAIHIPEDGTMEIFEAKGDINQKRDIQDPGIRATMRLFNQGDTVLACEGNRVYRLRTV